MTKGFYYSQHRSQHKFHLFPMASSPRRVMDSHTQSNVVYTQWRNSSLGNPSLKKWLLKIYNLCIEGILLFIFPVQETKSSAQIGPQSILYSCFLYQHPWKSSQEQIRCKTWKTLREQLLIQMVSDILKRGNT